MGVACIKSRSGVWLVLSIACSSPFIQKAQDVVSVISGLLEAGITSSNIGTRSRPPILDTPTGIGHAHPHCFL